MSFVVHRVAKSAARYTDAGGREKCAWCRFFVAPRACGKVIGPVSPQGWCKYFSRQVAQQYSGAGITGGGGPPGATLALDFMSSGNMPAGVTFTRASTATYTDASGVIQTAAVNQPRWDYAGGSLRGLLIEEARTNVLLQSADISNAAWQKAGIAGPVAPVVTANSIAAPDGTVTASRAVFPAVSTNGTGSVVAQPFTATAVPYSASVWLKGAVGGEQLYIMLNVTGGAVRVTLTTTWQRFVVPAITLIAGQVFFQIGADLRDIAQTAILAQTVYVWGAQTEPGAFTTSYIPTAGATATRAVDLPSITPANMAPWFNTSTGSWFAEFVCAWLNGQYQRVIYFPPINAATMIGSDNTAHAFHYDVGPVNASANTITVNAVMKATSSWAAATGRICLNAGGVVTTGGMNNGFAGAASAGIGFMQAATPSSEIMSGYLRRVQYWPRILSDAEMQQVTT